jgi:hypothetical protein
MCNGLCGIVQRGAESGERSNGEAETFVMLQDPACAPQQVAHRAGVHSARFWHVPSKDCSKEADRKGELGGATEAGIYSHALLATCSGVAKGGRGANSRAPGTEAAIKIWDVANGMHLKTLWPPEGIKHMHAVRWSPDGRHVTCTMFAPSVCVWCARTGQIAVQLEMSADVSSVEWSHDGSWLAVGMAQGVVELVQFDR